MMIFGAKRGLKNTISYVWRKAAASEDAWSVPSEMNIISYAWLVVAARKEPWSVPSEMNIISYVWRKATRTHGRYQAR